MILIKRLMLIIKFNLCFIILIGIAVLLNFLPISCFLIFIIGEILISIYLKYMVLKPFIHFNNELNQCVDNGNSEQFFDQLTNNIVFGTKMKKMIEIYSNKKLKENSVKMYNKQAELAALQSQINPHFLYNTLESIRGQALIDNNNEIAKMVEALAAFFRYSISRKGELVTLRDELTNIQNYMMIEQYRFNNRFSLEILIDDENQEAYDYFILKLILQPVVENAIFHGLQDKLENGKIIIKIDVTESTLFITVSDNGKGMDGKSLERLNKRIRSAHYYIEEEKKDHKGIALINIQKRIQLLFGEEYGLTVYSTFGEGTDVEFILPADYERKLNHEKGNSTHSQS